MNSIKEFEVKPEIIFKRSFISSINVNNFYRKLLFTFAEFSPLPFSFFPLIYKSLISKGSCSVVYNSRSITILKLEIPEINKNEIIPKINELIKILIDLKNYRLLFLNHYQNEINLNRNIQVLRIEIIYSS